MMRKSRKTDAPLSLSLALWCVRDVAKMVTRVQMAVRSPIATPGIPPISLASHLTTDLANKKQEHQTR